MIRIMEGEKFFSRLHPKTLAGPAEFQVSGLLTDNSPILQRAVLACCLAARRAY